jgi:cell division septation protein DedD
LEQQAKERLTGGVILVVLLVLLVPELLTGPRPAPPLAPAQPDQAPMRSYTLDLGDSAHANRAPVAASTAAPPVSEAAVPAASAPDSAPAQPVPAPVADAPRPLPAPAAPAHPAARVSAHATEHVPAHGAAAWTVQLGTFTRRDNAARLVSSLKSRGFNAGIFETARNGHRLFRVRVGAERDRAAAEKLAGRLTAAGETGGEVVPR